MDPNLDSRHVQPDSKPESAALAQRREEIESNLVALVSQRLVEEYRDHARGRHSPALAQILSYFRQAPTVGKLALLSPDGGGAWRIVALSGDQIHHHEILELDLASEDEAAQEVFIRRLCHIGATKERILPVQAD